MRRIAGADVDPNANGAGLAGFRAGTPGISAGTELTAQFLNDLQEEIVNVVGLDPTIVLGAGGAKNQAAAAIAALVANAIATATANATAAADALARMRAELTALANPHRHEPGGTFTGGFYGAFRSANYVFALGASGEIQRSGNFDLTVWEKIPPAGGYSGTFYAGSYFATIGFACLLVGSGGEIQTFLDVPTPALTHRTPAGGYSGEFRAACGGPGLAVIVGQSGEIQTSPDLVTWNSQTPASGYAGTFRGVAYCAFASGGRYVAVGDGGEIQTSPDGFNWTRALTGGAQLNAIAYGNGEAYVVGDSGRRLKSTDGATWTALVVGAPNPVNAVAYCAETDRFVAYASDGDVETRKPGGGNPTEAAAQVIGDINAVCVSPIGNAHVLVGLVAQIYSTDTVPAVP